MVKVPKLLEEGGEREEKKVKVKQTAANEG